MYCTKEAIGFSCFLPKHDSVVAVGQGLQQLFDAVSLRSANTVCGQSRKGFSSDEQHNDVASLQARRLVATGCCCLRCLLLHTAE